MFSKILIANRGEIACRVIRTARTMGIATVAVYSEADRAALHVEQADESVCIGPAACGAELPAWRSASSKSAARRVPRPCIRATASSRRTLPSRRRSVPPGSTFIGPPPKAITAMGDKITSKKIARAAGVNTVPGHADVIADADQAVAIAREVGYPAMLKASAGGGGKGMRIAWCATTSSAGRALSAPPTRRARASATSASSSRSTSKSRAT